MRVLMISDHADPLALPGSGFHGGQNVYVRRLADSGCRVDVATRADTPDLPTRQSIADAAQVIRIEAGPRARLPRDRFGSVLPAFSQGVDDLCRRGGYDVVHSHYWFSGVTALGLAARHGLPVVHSHHSIGAVRRENLLWASGELFDERHGQECQIGREAAAVVANCPAEADDMRRLLGTPASAVHLVPPGVMPPLSQAECRVRLGLPHGVPLVLFAGRLEERKGCLDLIRAFAAVSRELLAARLVAVGGGQGGCADEAGPVHELVRQLGLGRRTDLLGSVPHELTPLYYSAADVTAVPSHYEPFGLVAVESMACGTPVVATRVGGLGWSVVDGRCGALVVGGRVAVVGDGGGVEAAGGGGPAYPVCGEAAFLLGITVSLAANVAAAPVLASGGAVAGGGTAGAPDRR